MTADPRQSSTASLDSEDWLLERLAAYAALSTGLNTQAISTEALRRLLRGPFGRRHSRTDLLQMAADRAPALAQVLRRALAVRETYFFRHPEHFRFLTQEIVPRRHAGTPIRAWSAGCATGEETYSLAACLLASAPPGTPVEVIGTDLLEENLAVARRGEYESWSLRDAGPLLHPVFVEPRGTRLVVREAVRAVTRFVVADLLEPPPWSDGSFDIVFCRNVLIYFTPRSCEIAATHVGRSLAAGGVAVFGTMDLSAVPAGLVRISRPDMQIFARPEDAATLTPREDPAPAAAPRARRTIVPVAPEPRAVPPAVPRAIIPPPSQAPADPAADAIRLHVHALSHIERSDRQGAERALRELYQRHPAYLPGLFELALLCSRDGRRGYAEQLMRELLDRARDLPADASVEGPEPVPARFYIQAAEAFLERRSSR